MSQRCSFCGKTEKQHGGKPCIDPLLKELSEHSGDLRSAFDKNRPPEKHFGKSARKPDLDEQERRA